MAEQPNTQQKPPPQNGNPPQYGSGVRPEFPDWGWANIFDPFGVIRTASVGGDLLSTDPFWQFDRPPAPRPPREQWNKEEDPFGLTIPGLHVNTQASLNALNASKKGALDAIGAGRGTLLKFQQDNDAALAEAKAEWDRAIREYKDFSAATVQRSLVGIDKQFEQNAMAARDQMLAAGIPEDQIDGQINVMRMEAGYQKGMMIGEASARVNENRLAAETNFYNTYFSLVGQFETAEAQMGLQYDLAEAEINRWWGESWTSLMTQTELMEMQADMMELGL